MKCPNCGCYNPEATDECGCGYDLNRHEQQRRRRLTAAMTPHWHMTAANAIIAIGFFDLAAAYLFHNAPGVTSSGSVLSTAIVWRCWLLTVRARVERG